MKALIYPLVFLSILFFSCESTGKRDTSYLPESVGAINGMQVVISNELWNGEVGEKIREYFAAPTIGLPQIEPIFSINQIQPENFTDFARSYRTFMYVSKGDSNGVSLKKNSYARPQIAAFITMLNSVLIVLLC